MTDIPDTDRPTNPLLTREDVLRMEAMHLALDAAKDIRDINVQHSIRLASLIYGFIANGEVPAPSEMSPPVYYPYNAPAAAERSWR